jgi:phosphoribosyl-AMP cyclohydrolase
MNSKGEEGDFLKLEEKKARAIISEINFGKGLVTAIARDFRTKDILMVAHMNKQALIKTLTTGFVHYWSRSRKKLWLKGEKSKNYQLLKGVWIDCDGDSLIFDVEQIGWACHMGYRSCFFRRLKDDRFKIMLRRKFKPEKVYE